MTNNNKRDGTYHLISVACIIGAFFLPPMVYGLIMQWGALWLTPKPGGGVDVLAGTGSIVTGVVLGLLGFIRTVTENNHD